MTKKLSPSQEDLFQAIRKLESFNEEKIMTPADYLKPEVFKRGIEKGIEEGIEKGIKKGRRQERIEMIKAMLLKGIDLETVTEVTTLSKAEIQKLLS